MALIWSDGAATGNWNNPGNWAGGIAPTPGSDLSFPSGLTPAQRVNNNDTTAGTVYNSLTYSDSGYITTGNNIGIDIGGFITYTSATGTTTINIPIAVSSTIPITVTDSGSILQLGASSTISGGGSLTFDSAGQLQVDGSITVPLLVYAGILSGSGSVNSVLVLGGEVEPATLSGMPAVLTATSTVTFNPSTSFAVILNSAASPTASRLAGAAAVSLGTGTTTLNVTVLSSAVGDVFTIVTGSPITGFFAGLPDGSTFTAGGDMFRINYTSSAVTLTQVSSPPPPTVVTSTMLTASASTIAPGQSVTLTATITSVSSSVPAGGTVTFFDNGVIVLGVVPVTLVNGVATAVLTTTALTTPGAQVLTASYSGLTTIAAIFSPSVSNPVTVTVSVSTTTFLSAKRIGCSKKLLILEATVTSSSSPFTLARNIPTGTVTFFDRHLVLGTVALSSTGQAALTVILQKCRKQSLTAVYNGTTGFGGSISNVVNTMN